MIGEPGAAALIRKSLGEKATAEERGYGMFGLALTGEPGVAADIVKFFRKDQMRNAFIAGHAIYALGMTKDRRASTFAKLIELLSDDSDMYVKSAVLMALGRLAQKERYDPRHSLGAGHNYAIGYDFIEYYFYMI